MKFKTMEEARREAMDLEETYARETFCPLLKGHCRTDCVNFKYIKISKHNDSYEISSRPVFGCRAYLFKGE